MTIQKGRVVTVFLFVCFLFSAVACNEDREPKFTDELPEGMATEWEDSREEFSELSNKQLDEWEEFLSRQDEEFSEDITAFGERISSTRERITELGEDDFFDWEEERNVIADTLNSIENDLEERFPDFESGEDIDY